MSKVLVVYYSFEGSTKKIAEAIALELNADLMEIKPKKEIQSKGFAKYLWGGSQVVMGKTPELLTFDKDIDDYDTVLIGTPIWAGTYAPPIKSLLEGDYIKGKKVAYFYAHEGGHGKATIKAKAIIERNNTFLGAKDLLNPKKNMESILSEAREWSSEIVNYE